MTTQDLIQRLFAHMGVDTVSVEVEEGELMTVQINVSEEDSGLLIGYHGETLASLQRIIQLMLKDTLGEKKVVVNVNDYKQRREAQLHELTEKIAQRVLETGKSYMFSFMPANERLIVHQALSQNAEFSELESISTGEGNSRRLEIRIKQAA
jgi:spoIIIJ-associated protein